MLSFLCDYDHSIVQSLQVGFTFGFPLHSGGPRHSHYTSNLLSATQNPNAVDIKLSQELETQSLAGLFTLPRFSGFRVGLVLKKVVGEFRLFHNLSYTKGSTLNNGISTDNSASYTTV